jgi:hypothetical protein
MAKQNLGKGAKRARIHRADYEMTKWGSSWAMERVCGRSGIRKSCGKVFGGRQKMIKDKVQSATFRSARKMSHLPVYSVMIGVTSQPFHAFFGNDGHHDEASYRIRPP